MQKLTKFLFVVLVALGLTACDGEPNKPEQKKDKFTMVGTWQGMHPHNANSVEKEFVFKDDVNVDIKLQGSNSVLNDPCGRFINTYSAEYKFNAETKKIVFSKPKWISTGNIGDNSCSQIPAEHATLANFSKIFKNKNTPTVEFDVDVDKKQIKNLIEENSATDTYNLTKK